MLLKGFSKIYLSSKNSILPKLSNPLINITMYKNGEKNNIGIIKKRDLMSR